MLPQFNLQLISGVGFPIAVHVSLIVPPTRTVSVGTGGIVTIGAEQPISSVLSTQSFCPSHK